MNIPLVFIAGVRAAEITATGQKNQHKNPLQLFTQTQ